MAIELSNLAGILAKIKEVTGLPAYFNDRVQTTGMAKFDLRYKGFAWKAPFRKGLVQFELALISCGIGESFVKDLINLEIELTKAFEMPCNTESTERLIYRINDNESIEFIWNDDLGTIESESTDKGVDYTYKRYFTLNYEFKNN